MWGKRAAAMRFDTFASVYHVCLCQVHIRLPTRALKPRGDVTRCYQGWDISGPKNGHVSNKNLKKNKENLSFCICPFGNINCTCVAFYFLTKFRNLSISAARHKTVVLTRMHSSRMYTARSLPYRRESLSRGVSVQGGLCLVG